MLRVEDWGPAALRPAWSVWYAADAVEEEEETKGFRGWVAASRIACRVVAPERVTSDIFKGE
jgi:hypothetical protein